MMVLRRRVRGGVRLAALGFDPWRIASGQKREKFTAEQILTPSTTHSDNILTDILILNFKINIIWLTQLSTYLNSCKLKEFSIDVN
jgi:hypothetical protein